MYDDGDEEHTVEEGNLRGLDGQSFVPKGGLRLEASRQSSEYADDFER